MPAWLSVLAGEGRGELSAVACALWCAREVDDEVEALEAAVIMRPGLTATEEQLVEFVVERGGVVVDDDEAGDGDRTGNDAVAEHAAEKDLDPSRIAVAGDSVGGNMAAALTLMAKQRSGPKITTQVLFYPVTDASFDTPSYHQFAEGYFLRRDAVVLGPVHDRRSASATRSPLRRCG